MSREKESDRPLRQQGQLFDIGEETDESSKSRAREVTPEEGIGDPMRVEELSEYLRYLQYTIKQASCQ